MNKDRQKQMFIIEILCFALLLISKVCFYQDFKRSKEENVRFNIKATNLGESLITNND